MISIARSETKTSCVRDESFDFARWKAITQRFSVGEESSDSGMVMPSIEEIDLKSSLVILLVNSIANDTCDPN